MSPNDTTKVGLKLRSHTAQLKDVQRRTQMASMGVPHCQLETIRGDNELGRRDSNVHRRNVDLGALAREMLMDQQNTPISPVENTPVELPVEFPPRIQIPQASLVYGLNTPVSPVDNNPIELPVDLPPPLPPRIQIPQACEVHELDSATPSPSSRSPVCAQPNGPIFELPGPPRIPQIRIHPPRSSPVLSKALPTRKKLPNYNSPTVEDCDDEGNGGSSTNTETKPLKQIDTDMSGSKEEKYDIQKEVNKYKERLQELEKQRLLENL